jgi:tetratricopeptide (TPR) repeat protein
MRRPLIAAALAGTLLWAAPAAAQTLPGSRVLVMPFAASADAQAPGGAGTALWLGEAAAVLLTERLEALGAEALPREHRVAVFDQLQLPMSSSLLTRATMLRVGELIGASEVITGEIRLAGTRLSVRARLVRLDAGRQLPEITEAADLSGIFALFDRLAARLSTASGRVLRRDAEPPPTLPLETFENYIKGLVAATPATQQRFLETAMMQAPNDARILVALWSVYTDQGAHEKALQVASAVPAGSPLSRRARFAVALSLIELRRYEGAFKQLTELHAERPAAALSNAIGVVQLRRGATDGSGGAPAPYFARAVDLEPANTDYLFNLGYARAVAGDAPGALQWLRETVRYDAADGDAHLVMSALLSAAGRTAEAHREFDLARLLGTSLDPMPAAPAPRVPPSLERLRTDLDPTAQRLEAVSSAPAQRDQEETAAFHLDAGRRLVTQRRDREAMNELRRAIYLAPYRDEPHLLLGRIYQRGGRLEEAIDEFKVALWCRETIDSRLALGAALLEVGDREAARREIERALVLDPDSTAARELLARIGGGPGPASVLTSGRLH